MRSSQLQVDSDATAEALADHYEWMLQWATHFARNDRLAAEDLVQETILKVIHSYPRRSEIGDLKALLFVTLKNTFLTSVRRNRSHLFEDLSAIDFDSLQQSLRESRAHDAIDVQNRLRNIAAYLCWRKQSTKSASILILRFFHEYLPSEIMQLGLLSRKAVEHGLQRGREDLKAYLDGSIAVHAPRGSRPPQCIARSVAIPNAHFIDELLHSIEAAQAMPCLQPGQLLSLYQRVPQRPLDCDLLAHLVSCRRCRSLVSSRTDRQVPPAPCGDDSEERRKPQDKIVPFVASVRPSRPAPKLERKLREIHEHYPRSLMVLANAEVLATRDVNAKVCVLKVEVKGSTPLESIEVFSEQGVCLLSMFVAAQPPLAPPTISKWVELDDDRRVGVVLNFTAEGPIVELTYCNPLYTEASEHEPLLLPEAEPLSEAVRREAALQSTPSEPPTREQTPSGLDRFLDFFLDLARRSGLARVPRVPVLACSITLALLVAGFLLRPRHPFPTPQQLLQQAESAETAGKASSTPALVRQEIRLTSGAESIERAIYRDVRRKRQPKPQPLPDSAAALQRRLQNAGLDWDDPLSSVSYQGWHDRARVHSDQVSRPATGELLLTTAVDGSEVVEETLTIRTADFHPIRRTIQFRDAENVEIAELSYQRLPWTPSAEQWFQPLQTGLPAVSSYRAAPLVFAPPTAQQLDEAYLEARLTLDELHADTGEQITTERRANGIVVSGIVDSEQRKREIAFQLKRVPFVIVTLRSVDDLKNNPEQTAIAGTVQAKSYTASISPLETMLLNVGWTHDEVSNVDARVFSAAVAIDQEEKQLTELETQFASHPLSGPASLARDILLARHQERLLSQIALEQQAIYRIAAAAERASPQLASIFNAQADPGGHPTGSPPELARRNLDLCNRLIAGEEPVTAVVAIQPTIAQLRSTLPPGNPSGPRRLPDSPHPIGPNQ